MGQNHLLQLMILLESDGETTIEHFWLFLQVIQYEKQLVGFIHIQWLICEIQWLMLIIWLLEQKPNELIEQSEQRLLPRFEQVLHRMLTVIWIRIDLMISSLSIKMGTWASMWILGLVFDIVRILHSFLIFLNEEFLWVIFRLIDMLILYESITHDRLYI